MSEPKLSIALATYNGSRYLIPLLESLANQTRVPDQLVVSDDASTDETISIIEQFSTSVSFQVDIVKNKNNIGVLENFYSAFERCSGDIILYCDQDDIWYPDKLKILESAFSSSNVALALHKSRIVDENLANPSGLALKNPIYGQLKSPVDSRHVSGFGHQMAFTRDVLRRMKELKGFLPESSMLRNNFDIYIPLCAALCGDIMVLKTPLVDFRRHSGSVTLAGKAMQALGSPRFIGAVERSRRAYAASLEVVDTAIARHLVGEKEGTQIRVATKRRIRITGFLEALAQEKSLFSRMKIALKLAREILKRSGCFSNERRFQDLAYLIILFFRGAKA